MKIVKKILAMTFALTLLLNTFGAKIVVAEGGTVFSEGHPLPGEYQKFGVTLIDDGGLYHHDGTYEQLGDKGNDMLAGPYTVKFGLTYYNNTPLTAEVKVTNFAYNPLPSAEKSFSRAYIDSENLLQVGWLHAHVQTTWSIKLYDADGNSYLKYFLFGFMDPDESDYDFDSAGRVIYFDPEKGSSTDGATTLSAQEYFLVNHGFKRADGITYKFNDAIFVVSMFPNETEFVFNTITPDEGALQVPHLYSKAYNIHYNLGDEDGATKAVIEPNKNLESYGSSPKDLNPVAVNPTRQGYDFVGWRETDSNWNPLKADDAEDYSTVIPAEASGDKYFKAYWVPHKYHVVYEPNTPEGTPNIAADNVVSGETENQPIVYFDETKNFSANGFQLKGYKFQGWSKEAGVKPVDYKENDPYSNLTDVDDATVHLYAQWSPIEYKIQYAPNEPEGAPKATGEMPVDEPRYYDTDYNLTKNAYSIEGYDFLGWNTVGGIQPVTYNDQAGYRNLVDTDGGVVTMYAQWKPWTYSIAYEPNGGSGTMETQVFSYFDNPMLSNTNQFYRDGYKFVGFDYVYNGVQYHLDSYDDFAEKLRALGPYSQIILVAQWKKRPDPIPTPYTPPVTGVE